MREILPEFGPEAITICQPFPEDRHPDEWVERLVPPPMIPGEGSTDLDLAETCRELSSQLVDGFTWLNRFLMVPELDLDIREDGTTYPGEPKNGGEVAAYDLNKVSAVFALGEQGEVTGVRCKTGCRHIFAIHPEDFLRALWQYRYLPIASCLS